jgi:NAD(P)-dependent dehydrogenase (short-subunit alcohol dehydrogenase family)
VETLQEIATRRGLKLMFDAAHAFGCSHRGRMIGGFGLAEVFSFHATKFLNSFEGGAITTNDDDLATMHDSQIAELVAVNVTGTILLTKYAVRSMLLQSAGCGGRIVNVSSIIAQTGFNGLSVYAATKAALNGFTRSLAREVGKAGITFNSLAPGYMQTDMTSALQGENWSRSNAEARLAVSHRSKTLPQPCHGS